MADVIEFPRLPVGPSYPVHIRIISKPNCDVEDGKYLLQIVEVEQELLSNWHGFQSEPVRDAIVAALTEIADLYIENNNKGA